MSCGSTGESSLWFHKYMICRLGVFFFFKQKTAYEMRISDWSSDVCSSDLGATGAHMAKCLVAHAITAVRHVRLVEHDAQAETCWGLDGRVVFGAVLAQHFVEQRRLQQLPVEQAGVERCQIGRASCRERVCQYV